MSQQADQGGFYRLTDIVRTPSNRGKPTRLPIGRTNWYEGIEKGIYPKPVRFGGILVWEKRVIHELEAQIASGKFDNGAA